MSNRYFLLRTVLVAACLAAPVFSRAQDLKHEFRGAWIATVINLDWPSTADLSTDQQQAELVHLMDQLAATGINAVFFQVRSESDAMYSSAIEPWSEHLTGTQGVPPFPLYDPLAFAVALAHERGMELHAWFNPFRVNRNLAAGSPNDPSHVSVQHPDWVLTINNIQILNPGIPEARQYIVDVILDVVQRYDIDGVHFDDYFYPYSPNSVGSKDLSTFMANNPDALSLGDWRRDNINRFVRQVSEGVAGVGKDVKFGISPFGIWKNGVPAGTTGTSAYDAVYADAPKWIAEGWVDYLAPQLYWKFGGGQDFALLAPWWGTVAAGRHIYPGLAAYKAEAETWPGELYSASEIPEQIRFSRNTGGVQGNVLFRAQYITLYPSSGLSDSLKTNLYANRAITPIMDWREDIFYRPGPPRELGAVITTKMGMGLVWSPPESGPVRRYAVYRSRSFIEPDPREMTNEAANLLAVTYTPYFSDEPPYSSEPYWYVVTALTANSVESDESNLIQVNYTGAALEPELAMSFELESIAPNPFRNATTIHYTLDIDGPLRVDVYDAIGRRVSRVVDHYASAGPGAIAWDGTNSAGEHIPSGIYFISIRFRDRVVTRPVVRVR